MRSVLKITLLLSAFVIIGGITGYLTLRFIIKSEDAVIVPDLVGKNVVYALEMLTDLGLNTKVSGYEYRTDVPKDSVARQDPGPGTEVKKDRDIRIVLSRGQETVTVPDFRGFDLREASILIADNGLTRGAVTEVHHGTMGLGEIGSQAPASGDIVRRGAAVDLLVGLGPRPFIHKMPNLENLLLDDAVVSLQRHGLSLGRLQYVQEVNFSKDVIVAQDPRPGYPVVSGKPVSLSVNMQKEIVAYDRGLTFFHYPVGNGFLKTHVRVQLHVFGLLYDLVDAFLRPGTDIWIAVPQDREAVLFVTQDDERVRSFPLSASRADNALLDGFEWDASGGRITALGWE